MATHNLAVIINNPSNDSEFLLVKQTRPPKFNDPEYDSFQDSDLWDLPCAPLTPSVSAAADTSILVQGYELCSDMVDLSQFDLNLALDQVLEQLGCETDSVVEWKFLKCIEEPEFGPGLPVKAVYIVGKLGSQDLNLKESCKWINIENCLSMLVEVKPTNDRVGHLSVLGILNDSTYSINFKIPSTLRCQEYPPGVKLIPMGSRTQKPFHTTNLLVFLPGTNNHDASGNTDFIAYGDALIMDPGCMSIFHNEVSSDIMRGVGGATSLLINIYSVRSQGSSSLGTIQMGRTLADNEGKLTYNFFILPGATFSNQLKEIIAALPRKLVVFVTHHHHDHVDGLSIVEKCNPGASLLAHEKTIGRISKVDWALGHLSVSGNEEICIGGQRLRIISAPGHTDGHMAMLHVSTNSLIVGDHCVGQGSALLDITSGGNIREYFQTTYKFMELSPHALIPMHGRVNLWPKNMLCGYLKNRRNRESTILKAIEGGAKTLFDIVAYTYADVDRRLWIPAASNVRLHVDHLAEQDKLPKDFSLQRFQSSCRLHFLSRWLCAYIGSSMFPWKHQNINKVKLFGALAVAGFAVLYAVRRKLTSK